MDRNRDYLREDKREVSQTRNKQGRIYWLWVEGTNCFKIGFTAGPIEKRISDIQSACPLLTLKLIARVLGTEAEERLAHKMLSAYRIAGREWYVFPDHVIRGVAGAFQCIIPEGTASEQTAVQ